MQDWPWEVADANRIDEFVSVLEGGELSEDERFTLMEIVLQSFEELQGSLAGDPRWARVLRRLDENASLHGHSIWYWSCVDSQDPAEWWRVTPFLREILERHRQELAVLPLERLSFEPMASGERSLRLTEKVTWDDFPRYARALLSVLNGSVDTRADSPAERVWTVRIRGAPFWLCFDDFGLGVSLDSRDVSASSVIVAVQDELRSYRDRREWAG